MKEEFRDRPVVVADINADPAYIAPIAAELGIRHVTVLAQPEQEVRIARLVSDPTRSYMPPELLRQQLADDSWPKYLLSYVEENGLRRVDTGLPIDCCTRELAGEVIGLLKGTDAEGPGVDLSEEYLR